MIEKYGRLAGLVGIHLVFTIMLLQFELYLSDLYEFPNIILIAIANSVFSIGLFLGCKLGYFQFARVPLLDMAQLAISYGLMVILDCVSLDFNSRGTYELFKWFNLPFIVILNIYINHQSFNLYLKLSFVRTFLFQENISLLELNFL